MLIRASATDFKESMIMLLQGDRRTAVNFRVVDGRLLMQAMKGVMVERSIPVRCDGTELVDITVMMESTISLLDDKVRVVDVCVDGDMLEVKQSGFSMTALRVPQQSMPVMRDGCTSLLSAGSLREFAVRAGYLADVAKILGESESPVDFTGGAAYLVYSNTAYLEDISLPDMRLTAEALKSLRKVLFGGQVSYGLDAAGGIFTVRQDKETIVATALKVNYERVQGIRKILGSDLACVGIVDIASHAEIIRAVAAVYKKCMVEVSFCERGIGIFVDSPSVHFSVGEFTGARCTIRINTAQLSCIGRLFGTSRAATVLRGGNLVCLMDKSLRRTLLLSGTIY